MLYSHQNSTHQVRMYELGSTFLYPTEGGILCYLPTDELTDRERGPKARAPKLASVLASAKFAGARD